MKKHKPALPSASSRAKTRQGRKKKKRSVATPFAHYFIFFLFLAVVAVVPLFFQSQRTVQKKIKGFSSSKAQAQAVEKPKQATVSADFGFCLRVPVLMYHHVQPISEAIADGQTALSVDNLIFEQQMTYLKDSGYNAISAKQLAVALRSHAELPSKPIVITLDDGYGDAYTYAFPVFKKLQMIGNLMISAGLVGGADYLSWPQIEEMAKSGAIYFTNHTWSHAALGVIDANVISSEVDMAKDAIKSHTGQDIDVFTYPYGSFNDTAVSYLQKAGYVAAYTTIPGSMQCDSFVLTLHRDRVGNVPLSTYGL